MKDPVVRCSWYWMTSIEDLIVVCIKILRIDLLANLKKLICHNYMSKQQAIIKRVFGTFTNKFYAVAPLSHISQFQPIKQLSYIILKLDATNPPYPAPMIRLCTNYKQKHRKPNQSQHMFQIKTTFIWRGPQILRPKILTLQHSLLWPVSYRVSKNTLATSFFWKFSATLTLRVNFFSVPSSR